METGRAASAAQAASDPVRTEGVGLLLGDGSVRFMRDSVDPRIPADMVSRAGGEVATE